MKPNSVYSNLISSIIRKTPLIAYISANRIGHQGWETLIHCSYARSLQRKLIIIYSSNVINESFNKLHIKNVFFINLIKYIFFWNHPFFNKVFRRIIEILHGCAFIKKKIMHAKSHATLHNKQGSNIRLKFSRFNNDTIGIIIDFFARLLPSFFSQPWSEYGKEYFNFSLLSEYFQPLSIKKKFEKQGEVLLQSLGLNVNDWFVCLHVRESTYLGDSFREWQNQNIEKYIEAIKYITRRGGYVIRMGDTSMRPAPIVEGLIDYACSVNKSAFGDLYLSSKARFCITNNSGYSVLPKMFRVPLLNINIYPVSPVDIYPETLTIFKKVYSNVLEKELSLEEIFKEPNMCHYHTDAEYAAVGLCILENTEDEIIEAVKDMFYLLDGKQVEFTPYQKLFLSQLIKALNNSTHTYGYGNTMFYPDAICKIAPSYIRKEQC